MNENILKPKEKDIYEFLAKSDLFSQWEADALKELIPKLAVKYLPSQQTLIKQGDSGDSLYIVLHGRLRITKEHGKIVEQICEIGTGDLVGEISLLVQSPRTASVVAIRDCVLLELSHKDYDEISNKFPKASLEIARHCIRRLIKLDKNTVKTTGHITTIAIVPISTSPIVHEFIQQCSETLNRMDDTLLINHQTISNGIDIDVNQISDHGVAHNQLLTWLNDQEFKHRYLLYQTDYELTAWSKLCIRQADRIYLICDPENSRSLTELEHFILNKANVSSRIGLILLHQDKAKPPSDTQSWLKLRQVDDFYHVAIKDADNMRRIARIISGKSQGLVLSGGGARGLAHIGLIKAIEELNIPVDVIGGTSSGSLIAAAYGLGLSSQDMMDLCKTNLLKAARFDVTLPYVSLASGYSLVTELKKIYGKDQQIEDLWLRLFCISTNLTNNESQIHQTGLLWRAVRASVSLPGVYPPVFSDSGLLVDGAVLNNLPVDIMNQHLNVGSVLASLISSESHSMAPTVRADYVSGWRILFDRINPFAGSKQSLPKIHTVLMKSVNITEINHQESQARQADHCIVLNMNQFSLLDFKKHEEIVEEGYRQAMTIFEQLKF